MDPAALAQADSALERLGDAVDVALKLLAAAGLFVYALVRFGHDGFYRSFGVTAEEAGQTQSLIIGRAAIYLVAIVACGAASALVISSLGLFFLLAAEPTFPTDASFNWFFALELGLFVTAGIIWFRYLKRMEGAGLRRLVGRLVGLVALFLGATFIVRGLWHLWILLEPTLSVKQQGRWVEVPLSGRYTGWVGEDRFNMWLGSVLTLFGLGILTWNHGRGLAARVIRGREVSGRILSLSAVKVNVGWIERALADSIDMSQSYLFLGEGERWLILFDAKAKQTIRLPVGRIFLTNSRDEAASRPVHEQ